jgi:hypothetical protein
MGICRQTDPIRERPRAGTALPVDAPQRDFRSGEIQTALANMTLMKWSPQLTALALAATLFLSGCASMSKSECMSANWEDVGIRDGAAGRPEEYLIEHSKACAEVQVTPDRNAWLKGREHGLERFCVPYRAYQVGESGGGFDTGMCAGFDQERLQNAFERGRDVNRMQSELSSLDSQIQDIRARLEKKDLEQKERERLAYDLGQLEYQRRDAEEHLEHARERARSL